MGFGGGHLSAALLFVALAALFYAPHLLGLRTFPDGDFTHHFLPFSLFQQQELLAGRLPVWNPYTYGGHPFLADVQAAVFYPLSNLFLLLTLPWTDAGVRLYWLQVEAVAQVALAGFFTYLLAERLTGSRWAAVLGGICFAFSGYLTGYPPVQLAVLRTAIWLPLLLWLLLGAVSEPRRWRWSIGTGVVAAVAFLAGHSQTFLFVVYTAAAWVLLLLALRWRARGKRWEVAPRAGKLLPPTSYPYGSGRREWTILALGLLGSGLLAGGLSAAQLLPSLEFAGLSVRANVDYAYVSGGFPLQDTWQLLLPGVLTQYSPLYMGVIGLGFAAFGALVALRGLPAVSGRGLRLEVVRAGVGESARPGEASAPDLTTSGRRPLPSARAGAAFFLGLALVALLLSYGGNGFLYPLFYRLAPGWNLFRGQERAAYLVTLGLSVLAAYGGLAVTTLSASVRGWWATAFAAAVIGGTYLFGLLWQLGGRTAVSQTHFLLLAALTVALVSAFALLLRAPGWSGRRAFWLLALAVANLFIANFTTNLGDFSPARKTMLAPEVQAVQSAVAEGGGQDGSLPGRVYNEFRAYEDYGMRIGVEDVWGASPLRLARYAALFEEFPLDRMWRLLGVEHVLTWRKELFGPTTLLGEFPQAADTTYLHRLPEPHPRAWLASEVRAVSDAEALQLLADHEFDLETIALLPGDLQEVRLPGGGTSRKSDLLEVQRVAPAHLRFTLDTEAGGLLVVSENWMPGWRVENISGEQAGTPAVRGLHPFAPLRADLTLVGVPVPAGSYTFDLVYEPDSVRMGLWISGGTLLILVVVVGWRWLRTRRRADLMGQQPA